MTSLAQQYASPFQIAAAAFKEGLDILATENELPKDRSDPASAFAYQILVSGFVQVETGARRYSSAEAHKRPNVSDPAIQAAVTACADNLDDAAGYIGGAAKRISATLRKWAATGDIAGALQLVVLCDAAKRMAKTKSGRAA